MLSSRHDMPLVPRNSAAVTACTRPDHDWTHCHSTIEGQGAHKAPALSDEP